LKSLQNFLSSSCSLSPFCPVWDWTPFFSLEVTDFFYLGGWILNLWVGENQSRGENKMWGAFKRWFLFDTLAQCFKTKIKKWCIHKICKKNPWFGSRRRRRVTNLLKGFSRQRKLIF
jgi:hypothetical protein